MADTSTDAGLAPRRRPGLTTRLRYRLIPDHLLGEILAKPWIDTAIPAIILAITIAVFAALTPDFYSASNLGNLGRVLGEYLIIALGQAVVILAGGIDLSIGSIFALCNFVGIFLVFTAKLHVLLALPLVIAIGGLIGAFNGYLIGYLRLRAFLTTLVTLIIVRSITDILVVRYGSSLITDFDINGIDLFDWFADGSVFGLASSALVALGLAVIFHVVLSRTRFGWHVAAVGGSRRSAFNAGIKVRRTVFLTYVISGATTGAAAFFYVTRLSATGSSTGVGLEMIIITSVILGGISLGGGRGSILKAVLGTLVVVIITFSLLRLGLASGGSSVVLGAILLLAVVIDIRWNKNRHKLLNRTYASPTLLEMPPMPDIAEGSSSPYARRNRLDDVEVIGKGVLDGPEDIIIDDEGNLFAGTRKGEIYRFFGPDFKEFEVFAHTGGRPFGITVDRDGSILCCVAGAGLYRITKDREIIALSTQTQRSLTSIKDDSRVRMADDLDVAPDGRIFYTDPIGRYDASEWLSDALEGRGTGRLLCFDPADGSTKTLQKGLLFANGVCLTHDGQAMLVAETWGAKIGKYWIAGPKKGTWEPFITDLPGYPDNINRASDGTYWVALVGMRSKAFDLALEMPGFRKRMIRRVAPDNWLFPNTGTGCILKFDEQGNTIESYWDRPDGAWPQITSMCEHKGRLFLGGVINDRVGVLTLETADPDWTQYESYWGGKA
ncbi:MAG: ABC transporter permease [Rhodobacteraceae bacterium]|uniref:Monosaccharide ABC transporter membrane protein, CUT2 family n=1 Tax=Salipiger profundus TaxID=1229727 RepID=A0A1U7D9W4_9RHOB|nr:MULTISPECIES: SMP-30/gluconolactonase/LRE family protein [Salipiger]APX24954.1 monosaccharide ABC transporter membrane protein, CUT2 family [Salipiger profundus]MAB07867.1 ABC transporter permease [Paracoccaceae bacterium]GFZ99147.1 ABC transporter permease [Salipiger profundus]SFC94150.1 monosaccharide ABC transporter membrane protein, CUT2 family [Salipiger profundus]